MDFRSIENKPCWKVVVWLLVNAVIPVLVPALCIWMFDWMFDQSKISFWAQFMTFMAQGYYIFSALTLFCSLLEDYNMMKKCANPLGYMSIGSFLTITMIIFYYQYRNEQFLQNHYLQFMIIWLATVVCAIYLKYRIVLLKK